MSTNTINTLNDSTDGSGIAGRRRYVRAGVTAGAVAAVANTVIAALADAADVSFAVPRDAGRRSRWSGSRSSRSSLR